jgi:hypothetical protein
MSNLSLFGSILLICASTLSAQDKMAIPPPASPAVKHYYRLNYVLKEWDDGKVINQRAYTLPTTARADTLTISTTAGDEWTRLRAGTRLPVPKGNEVSYIDVGVNIDNRLREAGDMLSLELTADITSAAPETGNATVAPALRQVRATTQSLITAGKPAIVFTADDPASHHRFELEVTATPQH